MIQEINIPSAGPCDIQSGRNVYIELNEDQTCTKASAGKILQFIKEGFIPVYKSVSSSVDPSGSTVVHTAWLLFNALDTYPKVDGVEYRLVLPGVHAPVTFYAYSDALDKPFTAVARNSGSDPGSGQTNN